MDLTLRPMSASQVLDRTFSLYRHNFLLFAGITALPPALLLIGELVWMTALNPLTKTSAGGPYDPTGAIAKVGLAGLGYLFLWVMAILCYALAAGATVYAVSRLHLGHPTTIAETYRLIRPHFGNLLGIMILVFMCVGAVLVVGALAIIVPVAIGAAGAGGGFSPVMVVGIIFAVLAALAVAILTLYVWAKLSLSTSCCVLEGLGVIDSMKRSWTLATGSVLRLILIFILAAVISWVISAALSVPYMIGVFKMVSSKGDPSTLMPYLMWQYAAGFLSKTLAGPILAIASVLIYYDQRVRKEAFDLQLMMQAIGLQPPPQSSGVAAPGAG